jgi:hypothetical protein
MRSKPFARRSASPGDPDAFTVPFQLERLGGRSVSPPALPEKTAPDENTPPAPTASPSDELAPLYLERAQKYVYGFHEAFGGAHMTERLSFPGLLGATSSPSPSKRSR